MSTAKGKAKKQQMPEYVTTGKHAAVTVTFGIVFLALGLCWLLAMLSAGEGYIAKQLALSLNGLCGPVCVLFPILIIWCGAMMLVSTRHRVNGWACVIALAMYVLILTAVTLTARCATVSGSPNYLHYLYENEGMNGYGNFLAQASKDGRNGSGGGLIGMLLAYPIWRLMGTVIGMIFVVAMFIVLIFLLLKKNPVDVIQKLSEGSEQRQAARAQRRAEKEAARAEREAMEAAEAARQAQLQQPVVQQIPMEYTQQPRQVVSHTGYEYPQDAAPAYPQQPVRQTVSAVDGFYPVSNELYDERFPLHPQERNAYQQPVQQQPVQQPAPLQPVQQPVYQPEPKPAPARRFGRKQPVQPPVEEAPVYQEQQLQLQPEPVMEPERQKPPVYQPVMPPVVEYPADEDQDELPWDEPEQPVFEPQKPVKSPYAYENEKAAEESVKTEKRKTWAQMRAELNKEEQPAPVQSEEEKPAPKARPSWSEMVESRQREMKMPDHTTQKGEPKQVFTDPVMPITGERIPIKPIPEPKADAKLDGTRSTQMKQTEMVMAVRYQAPPMRLLEESKAVSSEDSNREDQQRAEIIEGTLGSFGVDAEVKQIMHGPSITRFAIQIGPGVKVNKVTQTADNLALDLKTKHVRVEAPIQGTSYIGIEVPNKLVSTVSLREVLASEKMQNATSPLMVALGKDVAGTPVLCDLSKMPHLLIAGATGSGKSVCINSIVCSLLYRTSPEQVRLIMIDPKQVELTVYNSIPHLLVPVISDPRKAAGALAWVVQEMQERYGKFSQEGVRNLAGYNDMYRGTDKELPNIVVIIDEMADLMEVCRKDVEESIRRLAALARAAGIYMVLATQRPSVDVITGVVKNNIPSRIAFAVSSGTDSRTIIDVYGAEKLMGKGDMLYKPTGSSPVRVQGCFVSDEEVNAIADYIGRRYTTDYDPNIMEHLENADKETPTADTIGGEERGGYGNETVDGNDELLMEAIEMAVEDEQISTSLLQRRFRIGYARAGRLVDEMEKRGIVSASEGSKPRKCLITREQYYQMFEDQ